jgi:hypothetical protein
MAEDAPGSRSQLRRKWTVQLDEGTVKSGTAETQAAAMNSAVLLIDKALAPNQIKPKPPPSD